jgi:hypothetical protein
LLHFINDAENADFRKTPGFCIIDNPLQNTGFEEAEFVDETGTRKLLGCDLGECLETSGEFFKTFGYKSCGTGGSGKCLKTNSYGCPSGNKDLDLLVTEEAVDRFVGAVDEVDWKTRVIAAVVDSGAEESVAPPGCFPGAVVPSRISRAGGKYRAANGARIPNLGQVKVPFMNEDGGKCGIVFQVAEVERPLISATQLAASGNAVIIDGKGARIMNLKTKKVMHLVKRGGVYVLHMRVKANPAPGFPGPGR